MLTPPSREASEADFQRAVRWGRLFNHHINDAQWVPGINQCSENVEALQPFSPFERQRMRGISLHFSLVFGDSFKSAGAVQFKNERCPSGTLKTLARVSHDLAQKLYGERAKHGKAQSQFHHCVGIPCPLIHSITYETRLTITTVFLPGTGRGTAPPPPIYTKYMVSTTFSALLYPPRCCTVRWTGKVKLYYLLTMYS